MAKKKKHQQFRWFYFGIIFGAVVLLSYMVFGGKSNPEPTFAEYKEFGIPIPQNYQIHGIDVSKYQKRIDWDAVKSMRVENVQLGFAFIKATEGIKDIDPNFKKNWENAKHAGLARGAYHFFVPTKDGTPQTKTFIKVVKLESGDLPPVLDVENNFGLPPKKLRRQVKRWLDTIEKAYGVKPIIYTYVNFYERFLDQEFDDYPMWVAHYFQSERPRIARSWSFWQHNDQGKVNGIKHRVDFNVFNGDSTAFRALLVP